MKPVIVCVDDEQIVLKSLKVELKELLHNEYVVELAESAEEAIELFQEIEQDGGSVVVIITDFVMPGMNGYQLLERIQEMSPATEKIMLTGRATTEGIINTINTTRLFRFITKPWDKQYLHVTISEALRSYQRERQLEQQRRMLIEKNAQLLQLLKEKDTLAIELTDSNESLGEEITQHKQARTQLELLENYLRNIIDSMPSVLIGIDVEGMVTLWNQEAQRVTGTSAKEANGQPLAQTFPKLSNDLTRVREAILSRQKISDSKRSHKLDGETHYEDVTIYPLIANGVEGAVIRLDDVTEQVRLEEVMIQGEKMLSVGGLAAGMAHEINNPLAGMMQTTNVMRNRLTSRDLPANIEAAKKAGTNLEAIHKFMEARGILRMAEDVNSSGQRISSIVDNMLSFARKSESIFCSYDIVELLEKALTLAATDYDLRKQYDFKDIHIVKEYAVNLPLVPCEEAKIQQVLLNILRNGAQAMQKGEVKSPTFILRILLEENKAMVRIEIEDNGPGMNEATRKRVFEPFFTTKQEGEGTGLGLSVSYFIIAENHKGKMSVKSEPDKGARFIICLPLNPEEEVINQG